MLQVSAKTCPVGFAMFQKYRTLQMARFKFQSSQLWEHLCTGNWSNTQDTLLFFFAAGFKCPFKLTSKAARSSGKYGCTTLQTLDLHVRRFLTYGIEPVDVLHPTGLES